jgi:hypothetical protein
MNKLFLKNPGGVRPYLPQKNVHFFLLQMNVFGVRTCPKKSSEPYRTPSANFLDPPLGTTLPSDVAKNF